MVEVLERIAEEGKAESTPKSQKYLLFSEQYLEKPYTSDIRAGPTLTLCTIGKASVPDDPDWDDR